MLLKETIDEGRTFLRPLGSKKTQKEPKKKVLEVLKKCFRAFLGELYQFINCLEITEDQKNDTFAKLACKKLVQVDISKFLGTDRDFISRSDLKVNSEEILEYLDDIYRGLMKFEVRLKNNSIHYSLVKYLESYFMFIGEYIDAIYR